jgi:hypothetical protein
VQWDLDEVFISINGRQLYVWRAVDSEGEVLDILVQPRRDQQGCAQADAKTPEEASLQPPSCHCDNANDGWSASSHLGRHSAFSQSMPPSIMCSRPTPSDLPPNPALISSSGYADLAPGGSRSVNRCGHDHLACKFRINVTVPPADGDLDDYIRY